MNVTIAPEDPAM